MDKKHKKKEKLPIRNERDWIGYLLLGVLVVGAFLLRTLPSWNKVFVDGMVWFRGVDPWYHMRLADNMMANFPMPLKWDYFVVYPGGGPVGYYPLMSWLITIPGQFLNHEVVGALLPPTLGALTLIPVFYIGRVLFNKWVGLFSCLLIAILPTEFFHRSLLGFTDHHILEVFFSTLTILFLILSHKRNNQRYPILAGVSLGLYLSSWSGGLLLVLPIWIWFILVFIYNLIREEPQDLLCRNMTITFLISLLISLPNTFLVIGATPFIFLLLLVTLTPYSLFFLSRYFRDWARFVVVTEGAIILFILFCALYYPSIFQTIKSTLPDFGTTIEEAAPSYPNVLFSCYGLSFLLSLGGLFFAIRRKQSLLLIIWSSFMLLLVLGQRRWGYYFAIPNAIMASYLVYLIGRWVGKNTRVAATIVTCLFVIIPSIRGTIGISILPNNITSDWYQACIWLRENAPEPGRYYELKPEKGVSYGVLSWWDYGNWICRIGHKVPLSNPMQQDPPIQGRFFIAQSEEEANKALGGLDVRYIIVDEAMVTGKFYAIVGKSPHREPLEELRSNSFIMKLWEEEAETWRKVYQVGGVKVYESRGNSRHRYL